MIPVKSPRSIVLIASMLLLSMNHTWAQCTWSNYFFDSFESTAVIPHIIPGTTYQNTSQTFAGCIHSGSRGLYLNIADGFAGMIYNQPFNNLCVGQSYRFSFWVKDTWGGTNNLTFNVRSSTNALLATQTVVTNGVWANVVMPAFTATTSTIQFQIITNTAGGPGNDAGFDDLTLSICNPNPSNYNLTQCLGAGNMNLYPQINAPVLSQNGIWTGPSVLLNGYQGTFTAGVNTNGLYTYTVDGGANCPDSIATVQVQIVSQPSINPLGPINVCNSYTLPAITGTNLSGNQHYYTGPNGTGALIANGTVITNSQTVYMYDGTVGCSDNEPVVITISLPNTAGNNNGASYCGAGPTINLVNFLSVGATPGGMWTETTNPISGGLTAGTGSWNSTALNPGTYTFQYTVPANGGCPADVADFTLIIGNIPTVDLGNDTTLCQGQTIILNAGAGYDSYLWNNGSITPTKLVNAAGTYWVTVGTLGANQIINGDFEQGNTGFTTQYIPGVGGPWGQLSNAGTYAVTTAPNLVHTNFNACPDHTPAAGVNQLVVNGSSTANTEVWCQTVPVQPNTTYQFGTWVSSVVNDPNIAQLQFTINNGALGAIFSPPMAPCNWTQFAQNWMSGINTSAEICITNQNTAGGGNDFALDDITFRPVCTSSDTVVVQYSTPPIVNLGVDQFHCVGGTTTLDAQNAGLNFLWNTAETTQTIDVTTSGTYSVTVTNANNCSASDNVVVTFETPVNAGNDSTAVICTTQNQLDLTTLLQNTASAGGNWTSITPAFTGVVAVNGMTNFVGQAGVFDFQYVVNATYCPNDTAIVSVTIHQQPVAAIDQVLHFCNTAGSVVDFSPYLNNPFEPLLGSWNLPGNLPAAAFNTVTNALDLTNLPHGNYLFEYVLPAEIGCVQDVLNMDVAITAIPIVQFTSDLTEGCQPLQIQFTNQSTVQGVVTYLWDFGDGTTSTSSTTVTNVYESAQCYDVTLTAVADGLCTSSQTVMDMICVHPVPLASFESSPQQVYSNDPTIQLLNNSVNNDLNQWNFSDGGTSTLLNPEHTFPSGVSGNYSIELIVSTAFGCTDTAKQIIVIKDQVIYYVPNTFTPDGDEYNNIFIPILTAGIDLNDYHFVIYNRWGEVLFESFDVTVGWDGTYHGQLVPQGTYIWEIQFGLLENDKDLKINGHVNLTR